LKSVNASLVSLERFWTEDLRYGARQAPAANSAFG
jgi:hypothetical protein